MRLLSSRVTNQTVLFLESVKACMRSNYSGGSRQKTCDHQFVAVRRAPPQFLPGLFEESGYSEPSLETLNFYWFDNNFSKPENSRGMKNEST